MDGKKRTSPDYLALSKLDCSCAIISAGVFGTLAIAILLGLFLADVEYEWIAIRKDEDVERKRPGLGRLEDFKPRGVQAL